MEWADGGGAEEASGLAEALVDQDWSTLELLCTRREAKWRACLASILCPRQGEQAEEMLLSLTSDKDAEVAFLAVLGVAFYCGINSSANGPFIDPKIRVQSLFLRARNMTGLADRVRKVGTSCAPQFQKQFELLAAELEARP
jgi:hypothetical protein